MDEQNKNMILAVALSFLVILVWSVFFAPEPPIDQPRTNTTETGQAAGDVAAAPPGQSDEAAAAPSLDGTTLVSRDDALQRSERVEIKTDRLIGSLSLTGGRIDDLRLTGYRETIDDGAPLVTLLSPAGGVNAYYALYGWAPAGDLEFEQVPGATTPWTVESGTVLTQQTPVILRWDNGAGLIFRRTVSVDENYMFSITQTVENQTANPVRMSPYGIIARHGEPQNLENFYILHEGVVRSTDGELGEIDYDDMVDFTVDPLERAAVEKLTVEDSGWIGFTDKYWMTTLIPNPGQTFTSVAKYTPTSGTYQTDIRLPVLEIAPGATQDVETSLFAGAKEWEAIRNYEKSMGITQFVDSIDWGWFYFLTKPIFVVLHYLNQLIGNMGWAIIALTLLIKAVLFPLAYKSFVSMARMKELQPQMEAIKERAGEDKQQMQKEMMALYRKEKVNPASGCLPILVQIPIFFSLYKVIFVTIELRHAPFIGWVQDLSAPDPSSWMNLFGLLPYEIPAFLGILSIGVWPILMGVTMWLQQKLNPTPTDPTQAMIFAWLPWIFMFMLGGFASGLVIYWVANNTITFVQQYLIMRSQGVKPDVFGNILSSFKRNKASE